MQRIKIALIVTFIVAVLALVTVPVMAADTGNIGVMLDNRVVPGSVPIVTDNGNVMAAAAEFAGAMGGSFSYDSSIMTGTIRQGENELVFRLDDSVVKVNGKYMQAPAPMKIAGNRFMIPAKFVSEKLGAEFYMSTSKNLLMLFHPSGGKVVYQVMSGDTLWIISQLFGTPISTIESLNGLTGDALYVGQKLTIKNSTLTSPSIAAATTQAATIRSGAGSWYTAVGYLQAGTAISVVGKDWNWYKVITPKGNGYIYYSVVGIQQNITDSAKDSTYFDSQIPVDTSKDYVTYNTYTVQKGDSIWSISQKVGVQDFELAAANNISPYAALTPGQVLKVPVHHIAVKSTPGSQDGEVLDWFKEGQYVFPIGKVGKFIDQATGKSFMAERTMGANHSDTETLTAQDSQAMKDIFGGNWIWTRRPFILEVDGRRFAVSVAGQPHAGVDGVPYLQNVDNRSYNWGYGPNYDSIAGNGMDGHFDVYFLNSITHNTGKLDPAHQYRVLVAGGLH